jgi:hypothetical protein
MAAAKMNEVTVAKADMGATFLGLLIRPGPGENDGDLRA